MTCLIQGHHDYVTAFVCEPSPGHRHTVIIVKKHGYAFYMRFVCLVTAKDEGFGYL
jgi:hypothetical protein